MLLFSIYIVQSGHYIYNMYCKNFREILASFAFSNRVSAFFRVQPPDCNGLGGRKQRNAAICRSLRRRK